MKQVPVFSILSPVYNVGKFLPACIESVLAQTFTDWELILVDDGATDNSGKICDEYATKYPTKIKVFHNTNHGQLYSRNFAISKAQGSYYIFLDSDDKLVPNALETIYKNFQRYECDCVIYGAALISATGEMGTICQDKEDYVTDKRLFYRHILLNSSYNALWRKAIKSSLLPFKDYSSFYHIRYGEDLLQSLDILHNCKNMLFIPDVLYYYVQNPAGMIHAQRQKPLQLSFEVLEKVLEFLNQEKIFISKDMQDYHDYCMKLFEYKLKQVSRHPASLREKVKLFKSVKQQKYYTDFLASKKYQQPISLLYCQFRLGFYRLLVLEINFYALFKNLFKKEKIKNNIKKHRNLWNFFHRIYCFFLYGCVRLRQYFLHRKLVRIYQQNIRKIRVGFLVTENEKWGCQSLFDKLKKNPHFEPVIVLSSFNAQDKTFLEEKFRKNLAFFKRTCGNVIEAYDPKHHIFHSLKEYNLDIVFHQQPWGIVKEQSVFAISKFALSCYVPYGFEESYRLMGKNAQSFYNILFRLYVAHPSIAQNYQKRGYHGGKICAVGHPKLEKYLVPSKAEKKYVIYAPHHSIEPNSLRLGTFPWNGRFMLEYAKKHPEFNWVFKPHPKCKESLVARGLFKNRQELEAYYNQWAGVGKVYETGDYMDLFQQTRCLITDCCSFLVEFFPTEQPVIHLRRTDSADDFIVNKEIISTYYAVFDLQTLEQTLRLVLEEKKDPMKEKRLRKLNFLQLVTPASDNIIKDLEDSFS